MLRKSNNKKGGLHGVDNGQVLGNYGYVFMEAVHRIKTLKGLGRRRGSKDKG